MQLFGDLFVAPVAAQAIVPVVKIPGYEAVDIVLSREVLVSIFTGCASCPQHMLIANVLRRNITRWNDPRIQSLNSAVVLPADEIVVGIRANTATDSGINAATSIGAFAIATGLRVSMCWCRIFKVRPELARSLWEHSRLVKVADTSESLFLRWRQRPAVCAEPLSELHQLVGSWRLECFSPRAAYQRVFGPGTKSRP